MNDTNRYQELVRSYQIMGKLDENERPLRSIAEGQPGWEAAQKKLVGLSARRAELDAAVAALESRAELGVTPALLAAPAKRETVREVAAAYAARKAPALLRQGERGQRTLVAFVRSHGAGSIAELAMEPLVELLRMLDAPARALLAGAAKAAEGASLRAARWRAVRELLRAEKRVLRVLELGCGQGELTLLLALDGHRVLAIEKDARALAGLRDLAATLRLDDRITAQQGDVGATLPTHFDAVVSVEVVEHLQRHELDDLLRSMARSAPRLVFTTPNRAQNAVVDKAAAGRMRHPDHEFELTDAELAALLAAQFPGDAVTLRGLTAEGEVPASEGHSLLADVRIAAAPAAAPESLREAIVKVFAQYRDNPLDGAKLHRAAFGAQTLWVFAKVAGREGSVVLEDTATREVTFVSPGYQSIDGFESDRVGPVRRQIAEAWGRFEGAEFVVQPKFDGSAVLARRVPLAEGERTLFFSRGHLLAERYAAVMAELTRDTGLDALLANGRVVIGEMVGRVAPPAGIPVWERFCPSLLAQGWRVFDIREADGRFLGVDEVARLAVSHGLRVAPTLRRMCCATLEEFEAEVRTALDRVNGVKQVDHTRAVPDPYGEGRTGRFCLVADGEEFCLDGMMFKTVDSESRFKIKPELTRRWRQWHAEIREEKAGRRGEDTLDGVEAELRRRSAEGLASVVSNALEKVEKEPVAPGVTAAEAARERVLAELHAKGVVVRAKQAAAVGALVDRMIGERARG